MYRDQAYILTNIIMVLDALVVILAAYFSRWIYLSFFGQTWLLSEYEFGGFIIFTFFLNNTITEQRRIGERFKQSSTGT